MRHRDEFDDDDADFRDDESDFDGDPDDFDADDENTSIECPYCRESIYEDSVSCPHCGRYLSEEDAPPRRKPWWIVVGALVCLYIVYRWLFGY